MTKEELEKENANLKVLRKYELNVAKVEIEKLEKENAELKKRNGELAEQKASLERWFGEAKVTIKYLLDYPHHAREEYFMQHIKKAEQFLEATE